MSEKNILTLVLVCFVAPTFVVAVIYGFQDSPLLETLLKSPLFGGERAQILVWPVVWIYGLFNLLYGLYVATKRNEINQQGQITERYARAAEQLGNKKEVVRIVGLYAMERLYNDAGTKEEKKQIFDTIDGFIDENTSLAGDTSPDPATRKGAIKVAVDILARLEGAR